MSFFDAIRQGAKAGALVGQGYKAEGFKMLRSALFASAKTGWQVGTSLERMMIKHPLATLGVFGVIKSAYGTFNENSEGIGSLLASTSATSTGFDPMDLGSSSIVQDPRNMYLSQAQEQRFRNSTHGLVQGLHNGRHR
jgi:hypothetical protein